MAEVCVRADLNPEAMNSDEILWREIARIFANRAFMRPHASWFAGLASRSGFDRVAQLTGSRPAGQLAPLLAGLGRAQLCRLLVRSAINQDQAMSALRLTLVANISVPVSGLVLTNQFFPGSVEELLMSLPSVAVLVPLVAMLSILIGILWFAYAGVAAARDLNHLLRLRLAEIDSGDGCLDAAADDVESPAAELG